MNQIAFQAHPLTIMEQGIPAPFRSGIAQVLAQDTQQGMLFPRSTLDLEDERKHMMTIGEMVTSNQNEWPMPYLVAYAKGRMTDTNASQTRDLSVTVTKRFPAEHCQPHQDHQLAQTCEHLISSTRLQLRKRNTLVWH